SSTTWPAANAGIHTITMNSRTSLLIGFSEGRHAVWTAGICLSGYFTTSGRAGPHLGWFDALAHSPSCWERVLQGPRKDKGGHVIWNKGFAGELPNAIQNGRAKGLGAVRRIVPQALFYAFQAEFQVLRLFIFAFA